MANNKLYKCKLKYSGNEIEVFMILRGINKGKYCNYEDCFTLYYESELIFLDNGR